MPDLIKDVSEAVLYCKTETAALANLLMVGLPINKLNERFESKIDDEGQEVLTIVTPDGKVRAEFGDWIVKTKDGKFFVCKPDFFKKQ